MRSYETEALSRVETVVGYSLRTHVVSYLQIVALPLITTAAGFSWTIFRTALQHLKRPYRALPVCEEALGLI